MRKTLLVLAALVAMFGNLSSAQPLPPIPTTPPVPTINNLPGGWNDRADETMIAGWAVDFDTTDANVQVQIYSETNGHTKFVTQLTTSGFRPDVNEVFGITGNHGFGILTPSWMCDGRDHAIHVYALDTQTGEPNELPHGTPGPLHCGTPKPSGTINVSLTNDFGSVITTANNSARLDLMHIMNSGEAMMVSQSSFDPGIDAAGKYTFEVDFDGDPLIAGNVYELLAIANNHLVKYVRFTLDVGSNSKAVVIPYAPLTIFPNGQPPTMAPKATVMIVPALVCNNTYTADSTFQASIVFSGPGKISQYNETPSTNGGWVPDLGWCYQYDFQVSVDPDLPNGYNYCARIKVGPWNKEGYAEMSACTLKGVKQKQ